jgi:hypothetical protein
MAPLCLMWCLLKERNAHSFEDCETGLINLKKLVIQTLFMGRVKIQPMSECSYSDFLDVLSFLFELGVSCIHPVYFGLRPSMLFYNIIHL